MSNPLANIENISIQYQGKTVQAKRLTVYSEIPINIDTAWQNVQTPELLQFVAQGMISFRAISGKFPKKWEKGQTYGVKMFVFGFIPFGGTHYLHIEKIDSENFLISTREWDNQAKVWNHDIVLKDLGNDSTYYQDSITIYGELLTRFITAFAKRFYQHRQKRWQIVAQRNLTFGA